MVIRFLCIVTLVGVLVACQTASPPIPADPLIAVAPATAQVGDTVTVTYRGPTGSITVTMNGFVATEVGEPEAGDEGTTVLQVVVPAGASGWSSVAVKGDATSVELGASERAFFVGSVVATLGNTLQDVQDALDSVSVGSAVLIPAGTYSGNEPVGGLVIDNRLLVGSGEGSTVLDGATQVTVMARTINTAGIADLTLRADVTTVAGGTVPGTLFAFDPIEVPVTTSLGRFLVWNATLTGNGTITQPVIDTTTLEVTSFGVADGVLDRASSATNMAFEFDGATVRLNDVSMNDSSAIGPWTIVGSDVWVQDRFRVEQEAGNVRIERSLVAQVGDPATALVGPELHFDSDVFDGSIVDSELTSTGRLRFVPDDGGNRVIVRSTLRSAERVVLYCYYLCTLTIEDSRILAGDRIDLDDVGYAGVLTIVGSTLEAGDRIDIDVSYAGAISIADSSLVAGTSVDLEMGEGGSIALERSTVTSLASNVRVRVEYGLITITDTVIEAASYVDLRTRDAGDIRIFDSSITAGEYMYVYMDYFGTLLIEGSTLSAGTYIDIDPWSGGSSAIVIKDSTLSAIEYVSIDDTDGGDVTIEDSTLTSYCGYIEVLRDPGSIYLVGATLRTVGSLPSGAMCPVFGDLEILVATESGMVAVTGSTIHAGGDVLIEDYSGGSDTPPSVITQVGSADMTIDASELVAAGAVRIGTAGALAVTNSSVDAAIGVTLAAPLLGQIDTAGSTIDPTPVLITAF